MSIRYMAMAFASAIPPTERFVLLALCDTANDEGVCWPSIQTLARKTGLSERTVQRAVKSLELHSCITRIYRQYRTTNYKISNPLPESDWRHSVTYDPESPSGCHPVVNDTTQCHPEPSLNHHKNRKTLLSFPSESDLEAVRAILKFLKKLTGRSYREVPSNIRLIRAVLKTTPMDDVKLTLAYMRDKWGDDPKMEPYLRITTLFRASNWEQYLAEAKADWEQYLAEAKAAEVEA